MKKKIFILIFLFLLTPVFSQNIGNVAFINEIADKDTVIFADAVKFFVIIAGQKAGNFDANMRLPEIQAITENMTYNRDDTLRRGALARMTARKLNLGDSLFYAIFKTERYAFSACAANGIMDPTGSEWDMISGGELVEIMNKISMRTGGGE